MSGDEEDYIPENEAADTDAAGEAHEEVAALKAELAELKDRALRAMAEGGLQDQLGGGFFRYSVDERWAIPHFEKMLYDNGPLLALFTDAWQVSGDDYFAQVAAAIGDWVLREMEQPQGGYYATQDADSDGGEGRFYLWDAQTLRGLLSDDEFQVTAAHYGLDRPANFEGLWHLQTATPLADVATALGIDATRALALLTTAQERMRKTRGGRPAPGRDDKVIAAWNGLMIQGMASARRRPGPPAPGRAPGGPAREAGGRPGSGGGDSSPDHHRGRYESANRGRTSSGGPCGRPCCPPCRGRQAGGLAAC